MARPRKTAQEPTEQTLTDNEQPQAELNVPSYSILNKNNAWHLVRIMYASDLTEAGLPEIISSDPSQIEIEFQMKIKIAETLFV